MAATLLKMLLLRRLLLLLALMFFLNLAYACWQLGSYSMPKSKINTLSVLWNPFFSRLTAREKQLGLQASDIKRSLEFMTFARERASLSQKLMLVQREKLNTQPFLVEHWLGLITLERDAGSAPSSRLWSMEVALMLSGWNLARRSTIAAECITQPPVLFEANAALCRRLLVKLPYPGLTQNATAMGVDWRFLKRQLSVLDQQYGLSLPSEISNE